MPILPIPRVVPDTDILADEFNRAIDAIQDTGAGHDHNGEAYHGKRVDHDNIIHHGNYQHDRVIAGKHASIDNAVDFLFEGGVVDGTKSVRTVNSQYVEAPLIMSCGTYTIPVEFGYDSWNDGDNRYRRNNPWLSGPIETGFATIHGAIAQVLGPQHVNVCYGTGSGNRGDAQVYTLWHETRPDGGGDGVWAIMPAVHCILGPFNADIWIGDSYKLNGEGKGVRHLTLTNTQIAVALERWLWDATQYAPKVSWMAWGVKP